MQYNIHTSDVLEQLRSFPSNHFDALLCDPPYALRFMGKAWDYELPSVDVWREALRVLKPGANILVFGGPRTFHRLACNIEDAGFEMRDCLMWLFGKGMPKSLNVGKALDKKLGATRKVIGKRKLSGNAALSTKEKGGTYASIGLDSKGRSIEVPITAPATEIAAQWEGYGTALKPGYEVVLWASKPAAIFPDIVCDNPLCAKVFRYKGGSAHFARKEYHYCSRACQNTTHGLYGTQEYKLWEFAKKRAKQNGVAFALTVHDIPAVPAVCPILGIALQANNQAGPLDTSPSLDRIVPELGYVPGNVRVISFRANRIRNDATASELATIARDSLALEGISLDPAIEPIILARKPLSGTVAENVLAHGCGGLNIDGCRVSRAAGDVAKGWWVTGSKDSENRAMSGRNYARDAKANIGDELPARWPANVLLDEESACMLDHHTGNIVSHPVITINGGGNRGGSVFGKRVGGAKPNSGYSDSGGASRFFYTSKVSQKERNAGCVEQNSHPTIKPISLTRWLATLILPPTAGARLLVPYCGVGSEIIGALQAGWDAVIGIELDSSYVKTANERIRHNVMCGKK